jgi:deoxyribose-phosphate aldolase
VEQGLVFRGLYRVRQEIRQILRHLKVIMEEAHLLQLRITAQVVAVARLP